LHETAQVEYYLTKKNKGHTWYTNTVSVMGDEIWQSPFATYAAQRESFAPQSFAVNQQGTEHGVETAIAGRTAYVVMQVRNHLRAPEKTLRLSWDCT
jgi:hypothetical protein